MPQDIQEHQRRAERIEVLIEDMSQLADERSRATALELVQLLLDIYGEGLARVLELTAQAETAGQSLIDKFAHDDLVSSLLVLHGLHPIDMETRIAQALDEVRPTLSSQGGNVEFVKLTDGIAHFRLTVTSNGSSSAKFKSLIEDAIYQAVPELDSIQIEGLPKRPDIPIAYIHPRRHKGDVR
jgi:Fe-S cluster biogenesis protein NfuA